MSDSPKKKVLVTGGKGMLAYDFVRSQKDKYDIILVDREECDITSFESILQCVSKYEPDVLLNCAAYTAVDDAEDIGMKLNYEVNTLGVYHLAKATSVFGIEFITISTDYVFDGKNPNGYKPTDECHPINAYGMAKYLGEKLALDVNPRTVVIRTSWLYGGELFKAWQDYPDIKNGVYKNFVNTMLRLSEKFDEIKVVEDQHGRPTSCLDLSDHIALHIEKGDDIEGGIFHFSGDSRGIDVFWATKNESRKTKNSITWADFAEEIFEKYEKKTKVIRCKSSEYPTKARRPEWSIFVSE